MSLFSRIFGHAGDSAAGAAAAHHSQAVLIYLDGTGLSDEIYAECDVSTLEDQIIAAVAGVGEYDGNEFRETETVLFVYGADAEAAFAALEPTLRSYPLCRNARVEIRKGGPGAAQRELRLPGA